MTMRRLRDRIQILLPLAGTVLVLGAVLFVIQLALQVALVVVGLLMLQAGVWRLAQGFLPDGRQYHALRDEVDRFIGLVRRLNDVAIEEEGKPTGAVSSERGELLARMHRSVDRMGEVAGVRGNVPEKAAPVESVGLGS
jgi:hypothetical protein